MQNTKESLSGCLTTLRHRPPHWLLVYISSDTPLDKMDFVFHQVPIARSFLVRCEILCALPFLLLGFCLDLTRAGFIHPVTSLWVHVCITSVVSVRCCYRGIIHHLWLLTWSHLFDIEGWSFREGFDEDIPFRNECSKVSHFVQCPVLGLYVNHHLLQKAFFL